MLGQHTHHWDMTKTWNALQNRLVNGLAHAFFSINFKPSLQHTILITNIKRSKSLTLVSKCGYKVFSSSHQYQRYKTTIQSLRTLSPALTMILSD